VQRGQAAGRSLGGGCSRKGVGKVTLVAAQLGIQCDVSEVQKGVAMQTAKCQVNARLASAHVSCGNRKIIKEAPTRRDILRAREISGASARMLRGLRTVSHERRSSELVEKGGS